MFDLQKNRWVPEIQLSTFKTQLFRARKPGNIRKVYPAMKMGTRRRKYKSMYVNIKANIAC